MSGGHFALQNVLSSNGSKEMFMYSALDRILDKLEIWPEYIQNLIVMGMSERLGRKVCRVWGERYEDVVGQGGNKL